MELQTLTTEVVKYSSEYWEYVRDSQKELYALNFIKDPESMYKMLDIQFIYDYAEAEDISWWHAHVLLINGQPKGFYIFVDENEEAYLAQIFVDSELRGKGYGAVLLDHFEKQAEEFATTVVLDMSDVNIQALNFYQSKGYVTLAYDMKDITEPRRKMAKLLR